jgi:hypothetical protein
VRRDAGGSHVHQRIPRKLAFVAADDSMFPRLGDGPVRPSPRNESVTSPRRK